MSRKFSGAGYRQARQTRAEQSNALIELELPSGFIFTVRQPDLALFKVSGALPQSVGDKMERAKGKGLSDEDAFKTLTEQEQEASFRFAKKLLRQICVNPRIVDDPQADDEISIEDLETEDFEFLMNWGGGGDSLDSFRGERQQPASPGDGGEVLPVKSKRSAGSKG